MAYQIMRSRTGTYHLGGGNAVHCNRRSMNVVRARKSDVLRASAACFCAKCFSVKTVADREAMVDKYGSVE